MVSVRNGVKRYSCACGAHELRSRCAPKLTFAEALQKNCKGIAIALQRHCSQYSPCSFVFYRNLVTFAKTPKLTA